MKLFSAQTIWKCLRLFVVLALAMGATGPGVWQPARAQAGPTLRVESIHSHADGFDWPAAAQVLLTVEDPATSESPDFSATATVDEWGYIGFYLYGVPLYPGVTVKLSDGVIAKEVILGALDVVFPPPGQSLVSGTADPYSLLEVDYGDADFYAFRQLTAGSAGAWQVDFSVPGEDPDEQGVVAELQPTAVGWACQIDAEGDEHCINYKVRNPQILARPWHNLVRATDWTSSASLTLQVDDPLTPASPDYSAVQIARPDITDPRVTLNDFSMAQTLNLRPGMEITLSDGANTKTHTVIDFTFIDFDIQSDTLSGSATPGSDLDVTVWDEFGEAYRHVTAGVEGGWLADFSQLEPGEAIFDLLSNTTVRVSQQDDDSDATQLILPSYRNVNAPRRITVNTIQNRITGTDWPLGTTVTLTVDDPVTPKVPDYETSGVPWPEDYDPNRTRVEFIVGGQITLRPGMLVTMTDEVDSRSLTLHNLGIRGVNSLVDTVSGFATPYSGVWVAVYVGDVDWFRFAYADENGDWTVDFSQPGMYPDIQSPLDLVAEMDVRALQFDEDGDMTRPSWRPPSLNVGISSGLVIGNRWTNGSTVTLTVDDPDTPLSPDLEIPQTVHTLWPQRVQYNLAGLIDFQPGHVVTLSNGLASRTLTLDNLAVTQVDVAADRLTGIAPPQAEVCLYRWDDETYELCVPADTNGDWSADLGYDLQSGGAGDAWIYKSNGGNYVTWYAGWSASDPETLVFAASDAFDLDVTGNETGDNAFVRMQLLESLLRPGPDGELELAAASGYTISPDRRVYTFTLRPDAYWSDGASLTAQHFVDGILRILDPALTVTGWYAPVLFPIQGAQDYFEGVITDPSLVGVRALNANTLEITLSQPAEHFLQVVAGLTMLPVRLDLMALYGEDWQAAGNFPSNGPYQLAERDGAHLLLEPNPYYHSPQRVTFANVAFSYIPVATDQLEAYRNGEVDVVLKAFAQYPLIKSDPALLAGLKILDTYYVTQLGIGVQNAPLDNPLVRQALGHAIDRQALLDGIRPASQIALGVIPPGATGYQGEAVGLPYNPTLAQQLLADAGYAGGAGFPEIELSTTTQMFPLVDQVAEQWRSTLNIPVGVTTYRSRNLYLDACGANPASCGLYTYQSGWASDYADGFNYLYDQFQLDYGVNWMGWDNTRYQELKDLILSESNPEQRLAYLNEAERLMVETDAVVIPLYYQDQAILAPPEIYPFIGLAFPSNYLIQWGSSDQDGDSLPDLIDPCPADPLDACDPAGSAAGVYGSEGGSLATEDGAGVIEVPPDALDERITFTIVDQGSGYVLDTDLGQAQAALSFDIGPSGTTFAAPATITLHWADNDNNGVVDGTDLLESDLYVFKDGVAISNICSSDPDCDRLANTFSVQVSSLSQFVLGVRAMVIDSLQAPVDPQAAGTIMVASAEVRNLGDDAVFTWEWGDGAITTTPAPSATHAYSQAGLYTLHLTVSRPGFASDSAVYEYIVIYDPTGGFVTGGGWIPAGDGKASFGFNARYQKNSTMPEGDIEFHLEENNLHLRGTAYDWLVIGSNNGSAIFRGAGLVNDQLAPSGLPYRFTVWAVNGDPSGQPDALRIKIWWLNSLGWEQVVFDNAVPQVLGGGSIVVHKAK